MPAPPSTTSTDTTTVKAIVSRRRGRGWPITVPDMQRA